MNKRIVVFVLCLFMCGCSKNTEYPDMNYPMPLSWHIGESVKSCVDILVKNKYVYIVCREVADFLYCHTTFEYEKRYGYPGEERKITGIMGYREQLNDKDFWTSKSESPAVYKYAFDAMRKELKTGKYKSVVQLDVIYGYVLHSMAKEFSDIKFIGVDKYGIVKIMNDAYLKADNLEFVTSDVHDYLCTHDLKDTLIYHSRQFCLRDYDDVMSIYDAGAKGILGVEDYERTLKPYYFADTYIPSRYWRWIMLIHNYPFMLKTAGYNVARFDIVKCNHPRKQYRLVCYYAERT